MSTIRSMRRHGVRTFFAAIAAATIVFALIPSAQGVHDDGVFELDRNATDAAGTAGADWNNLGGADVTTGIIADGIGPSIFTGGGSKDDLDTDTGPWKHKNGSVPDKDELLHGFAARYGDAIYFGADRYDNSGDAVMGFWFFQDEVAPVSGGRFGPDDHVDGDILILSDFTQGGGVVTIRVFRWNGPGGDIPGSGSINGTLDLLAGTLTSPADCVGPPTVPNGDNFCATVNAADTPAPWAFQSKDGPANVFPPGHFYEGGIDLGFLNLEDECFSSFLAESRSSTSTDSVLKDFVSGSFESCEATIVTTPTRNDSAVTEIDLGQSIVDVAVVTGTGTGNSPVPTGTVSFFVCAVGVSPCTTGGTSLGTKNLAPTGNPSEASATSDPFTPLAAGDYCFRGTYNGDDNYDPVTDSSTGECFTVNPRQPAIITNATAAQGVPLGTAISDSATLSNTANDPDGSPADGTITFRVYGPNDANCSGAVAFTGTANVQGDGTYSSGNFTPTQAGTYRWIASYSGDAPNTLSVSGACNDANEASLVIQLQPAISTAQWVYPNDSATVTVASGGGDLTGSVAFSLFDNATCTGTPLFAETITLPNNAGLSETVETTNGDGVGAGNAADQRVSVDGKYSWLVVYTSTNQGHTNVTSTCDTEHFTIDFTNS